MSDIVSPVQNISYTNKDFVRVYEELLDLAKELGNKWDPSLSNESDPGVILLKLNAVIADKCNYNIDKSVLECFPLSVTQMPNARQLFDQLGYRMHWRKSAFSTVNINWIGETTYPTEYITIDPFTMISDAEDSIVYTLLGPYDGVNNYNVDTMKLLCNGSSSSAIKCNVIQGVPVDFTVSGSKLITIENIDENNRLYFPDTSIAENGVFITNVSDSGNYNKWSRVDNLSVENFGNYYYKFDINKEGTNCYIEFPEDVESLFGEGIYIKYIRTDSEYGNINASILSKFYDTITASLGGNNVILNTDVISINNPGSINNGTSYETINDAYRNYKHTVGTFKTLVTLRDYINAIINSGLVSNGFVCDRTNDVQTTYNVLTTVNNVDQTITYIEETDVTKSVITSGNSEETEITYKAEMMDAFSLKLYLLNYVAITTDYDSYFESFNMITDDDVVMQNIKNYISSEKCISHDYENLLGPGDINPHVVFFRNRYPIECTITAQTTLNNQQKQEIRENIINALHDNLSSKQVEFGEAIEYDLIYNIISNADPRIKNVSLFNINYETEAVYYDNSSKLTYIVDPITNKGYWYDDEFNQVNPANYGLTAISPINGATLDVPPSFKSEFVNGELYDDIYFCSSTANLNYVPVNLRDEENVTDVEVNTTTFYNKLGLENCYKKQLFTCDSVTHNYGWYIGTQKVELSDFGISLTSGSSPEVEDEITISFGSSMTWPSVTYSDVSLESFNATTCATKIATTFPAANQTLILEYKDENSVTAVWKLNNVVVDLADYGIIINPDVTLAAGDQFKIKLSYGHQVKYDTIAKSVLVGSTQFYVKDETFDYRLNQIAYTHNYDNDNDGTTDETLFYIKDIAKLCGDVEISFTPTDNTYKLRDNESLQLYAPNLIDVTNYSNYVKFEYYITKDISAKSNYQLRNNEFVIFYWTESDDEAGVVYKYHCYGNGAIICPSFNMPLQTVNDKNDTIAVRNGLVLYDNNGNTIESSWSKNSLMTLSASEQVANITSSKNILSGSKTLKIKSVNEFTLTRLSQYYLYWVLEDESVDSFKQDKYTLFYAGETTRMLGNGEYLIYTDAYKKNYEILGEGTLLVRNTITNDWSVNAIDSSNVLLDGISAIEGNWFTLGEDETLTVTENSFTNIGSGCTISISAKDPKTNFYTLTYNSSVSGLVTDFDTSLWYKTFIAAGTYTLTYTEGALTPWGVTFNGLEGEPLESLDDVGITLDNTKLTNGAVITVTVIFSYKLIFTKDGFVLKVPESGTTSNGLGLSDFDIKYLLAGQNDIPDNWVVVDNVTLNGTINWSGRSLLSLNFGPSNQQYLLSHQSIHLIDKDNNTLSDIVGGNKTYYITIGGTFKEGSGNSCTLNSDIWNVKNPLAGTYTYTYSSSSSSWTYNSNGVDLADFGISTTGTPTNGQTIIITNTAPVHYPMVILGSKDINVYGTQYSRTFDPDYTLLNGLDISYLNIYNFTELQSIADKISYTSSGNVIFTFSPADESMSIDFRIPQGTYILPVKNNIKELSSLKISLDSSYLELMYADADDTSTDYAELKENGMHYLRMVIDNNNIHTLTVELTGHTIESAIQLGNCFKYVKPNQYGKSNRIMSDSEFNKIEEIMTYLDNKHIFKYDNIVNTNEEIKDPAAAASFNLINHIYNPFTICEFYTATIN